MPISKSYLHNMKSYMKDELNVHGLGKEFVFFRQLYHQILMLIW
jgi:hypothetical protein